MGYLQRDHGGAWWFRYSKKEGIRGKCMPWGTIWSWRFPLCRGGCEEKRVMGNDGLSLVIFHWGTTRVVLPGCPILSISLWAWVGELRGHTPLPLVYTHVSLVCKAEGSIPGADHCATVKKQEVGERGDFSSSGVHMDTQCCDMRDTSSFWGATATSKAVWTGRDATGHSPGPDPPFCIAGAGDIPRPSSLAPQTPEWNPPISALLKQAVTDVFTSRYTNLCANLWGFSCPDYSWGNNLNTPQTLSCKLSKKAFHFLLEDFERTRDLSFGLWFM